VLVATKLGALAALCPPGVGHGGVELVGNESGNLVLKALQAIVRKRQIVRVGTDPELPLCCWLRPAASSHQEQ
jgi:hypothetical protein